MAQAPIASSLLRRLNMNLCARLHALSETAMSPASEQASSYPASSSRPCRRVSSTASSYHQATGPSIDQKEARKFAELSASWWDPAGPFAALHYFNPARCDFIRGVVLQARGAHAHPGYIAEPLRGLSVLDVGCGGGILSESMARMGAQVHGIDITSQNVEAARQHAAADPEISARIRYEVVSAEDLAARGERYDVVLASEVIEHVKRPDHFVSAIAQLAKAPVFEELAGALSPAGGIVILSTINRTVKSFAVTIAGAEYITGIVPAGTHDWHKYITPEEMYLMAEDAGLDLVQAAGIALGLPTGPRIMHLSDDLTVNYIASFAKRPSS